ncbi:MAG TPA: peptide ABC transporter substrate-binding protein [Baekduia sp.]|uniref:ABC transporter substrate-binding protein n=1 Tax=Baekduia sp. TaxID=2600305 RepID=UPI002D77BBCA|nr:peptide ABC transporter substrate-binding protein [Baekduia sp.]HET6505365.1 peptide ABC transporter substrate-binding protein [Baekduia sp.]
MTVKRAALAGALLIVVCVGVVVALSGGSDSQNAAPARSADGRSGGALRMGTTNGLPNLNPFVTVSINGLALLRQMYPYLVQYDLKQKIAPDFAGSWKASQGGKTWTFRTTPKARWSDGRPLTARDAAWTIDLIKKYAKTAAANLAGSLSHVQRVRATDERTLVVTYDRPRPDSTVLGGLTRVPILPRHIWSAYAGDDGKALQTVPAKVMAVGGGPFTLTEFKEAQVALLKRNDNYYGPKPAIDGFGLQIFSAPEVELNALRSGEIDWIQSVPPQAMSTLSSNKSLAVGQARSYNQCVVSFNGNAAHTELRQPRVREAIANGIDVQDLIKVVMNGAAIPAPSIVPAASPEWRDPAVQATPFDVAAGNRILDALGYKKGGGGIRTANGHPMSYRIVYSAINPLQQAAVKLMATSVRRLGIQLIPAPATGVGFSAALKEDDGKGFDSVMDCWTSGVDPEFIMSFSRCDAIKTFTETNYCNKEFDELFDAQSEEVDPARRRDDIFKMQEILARDRPWQWLFSPNVAEAWSKRWTGFTIGPAGTLNSLTSQALLNVRRVDE